MKKLLILITIILIVGCASVGRKIDQSAVNKIEKGKTTREQIGTLLGSPDHIMTLGNGDVMYSYGYMRATAKPATFIPIVGAFAGGADVQTQNLIVTFSPDGLVKNFMNSQGGTDTGTGLATGSRASMPEIEEGKRPK